MKQRILLWWYRRKLRSVYNRLCEIEPLYDSGYELFGHISPLPAEINRLMAKCKELEAR